MERDRVAGIEAAARLAEYDRQQAEIAARKPVAGQPARIVKGRKIKVGTVGTVKRLYDGQYGLRVLFAFDGREEWTAATNVERINDAVPA
jgi:hypothetical protein